MTDIPKDMLADVKQIRKAARSLRRKNIIDSLIRRGIAPDRIERTIKNAEVVAEMIATKARSRIAHRKRAKLRIVKSYSWTTRSDPEGVFKSNIGRNILPGGIALNRASGRLNSCKDPMAITGLSFPPNRSFKS